MHRHWQRRAQLRARVGPGVPSRAHSRRHRRRHRAGRRGRAWRRRRGRGGGRGARRATVGRLEQRSDRPRPGSGARTAGKADRGRSGHPEHRSPSSADRAHGDDARCRCCPASPPRPCTWSPSVAAWAYNLRIKSTVLSVVPYVIAFGLLPAFVTLGLPGAPWPPWWAITAGALLGAGAHFANVVPDIADDLATGVRGLPQRLGRETSSRLAAVLLLAASLVLVFGPGHVGPVAGAGLAIATVLAGSGRDPGLLPRGASGRSVERRAAAGPRQLVCTDCSR